MKMFFRYSVFIFLFTFLLLPSFVFAQTDDNDDILFYGDGCPHCAKVEKYLEKEGMTDNLIKKEIYQDRENAQEFNEICEEEGIEFMDRGVPFLFSQGECFIGDKEIIAYLGNKNENTEANQVKKSFSKNLTIPVLLSAALVDAINPCAFAVLLILMTTILATGNRKKALFSGLAFAGSIFISYLLMGLGLYSIVANIETSQIFIKVIAILAIILGVLNLKGFLWYGKGFLMEVPESWRPKMKSLITAVTSPFGAFFVGFLVSLFLLPCTSGPYIVIIGMLGHSETYSKAVWLLILYNIVFVFPMILITIGTYFGMDIEAAKEKRNKNLKILHLIAGVIMIGMGFALLLGIFL